MMGTTSWQAGGPRWPGGPPLRPPRRSALPWRRGWLGYAGGTAWRTLSGELIWLLAAGLGGWRAPDEVSDLTRLIIALHDEAQPGVLPGARPPLQLVGAPGMAPGAPVPALQSGARRADTRLERSWSGGPPPARSAFAPTSPSWTAGWQRHLAVWPRERPAPVGETPPGAATSISAISLAAKSSGFLLRPSLQVPVAGSMVLIEGPITQAHGGALPAAAPWQPYGGAESPADPTVLLERGPAARPAPGISAPFLRRPTPLLSAPHPEGPGASPQPDPSARFAPGVTAIARPAIHIQFDRRDAHQQPTSPSPSTTSLHPTAPSHGADASLTLLRAATSQLDQPKEKLQSDPTPTSGASEPGTSPHVGRLSMGQERGPTPSRLAMRRGSPLHAVRSRDGALGPVAPPAISLSQPAADRPEAGLERSRLDLSVDPSISAGPSPERQGRAALESAFDQQNARGFEPSETTRSRSSTGPSGRLRDRRPTLAPTTAPTLAGAQIVIRSPSPPEPSPRGEPRHAEPGTSPGRLEGIAERAFNAPAPTASGATTPAEADPASSERSIERLAGLHGHAMAQRARVKGTWRSPPPAPTPQAPRESTPTVTETDLLHLLQALVTGNPRARRLLREVRSTLEEMRRMDHLRKL